MTEASQPTPDAAEWARQFREAKAFYREQLGCLSHPRWCRCPNCQHAVDLARESMAADEGDE